MLVIICGSFILRLSFTFHSIITVSIKIRFLERLTVETLKRPSIHIFSSFFFNRYVNRFAQISEFYTYLLSSFWSFNESVFNRKHDNKIKKSQLWKVPSFVRNNLCAMVLGLRLHKKFDNILHFWNSLNLKQNLSSLRLAFFVVVSLIIIHN